MMTYLNKIKYNFYKKTYLIINIKDVKNTI